MNTNLYFQYIPVGRNVTVENTANGDSATLVGDGRVERSICDQVLLEGKEIADFQESLDTFSIRALLKRFKQEKSESLNDRTFVTEMSRVTLGESWKGHAHVTNDGLLNATFKNGSQQLRLYGGGENKSLNLTTIHNDGENRSWAHHLKGRLDADYNLLQDTVMEQANVAFLS